MFKKIESYDLTIPVQETDQCGADNGLEENDQVSGLPTKTGINTQLDGMIIKS